MEGPKKDDFVGRHLIVDASTHTRRSLTSTDVTYDCAFCGEENETYPDPGAGRRQTVTEDCAVCCRPNLISLAVDADGAVSLRVTREYEA